MTDTKQPKEIFDAAEHFNRLHGHQGKENLTHTPQKKPWYQRQVDPKKQNKETELSVWNEYIKPIIKEYQLFWKGKLIEYKFFHYPEGFDSEGMYLMQRKMMVLCLGIDFSNTMTIIRRKNEPEHGENPASQKYQKLFEGPDDIIKNVMDILRGAKRGDKRTQILKDIFREFFIEIIEDKKLPYFLELLDREYATKAKTKQKKRRPNQEDKIECQKIAKEIWPHYQILDKRHIAKLPAIIKIVGTKRYKDPDTVPDWVAEVDPSRGGSRPTGRRSRETLLKQKQICEKLGIEYNEAKKEKT